jgi:O-antigen/teichoic acid export membrane protein
MNRTRRFLQSISLSYIHMALLMVVGLWLTPFFLRHISSQNYGLWLASSQILTYLLLLDFGVMAILPRETAHLTGKDQDWKKNDQVAHLFGETLRLVLWQTPLVLIAAGLCWGLQPATWQPLRGPLALVLGILVITFPLRSFTAVLTGLQETSFLAQCQLGVWILSTALSIGLVKQGYGIVGLAAAWAVNQSLVVGLAIYRVYRYFPMVWPRRLPSVTLQQARTVLAKTGWVSMGQIAQILLNGTDLLVLGYLLGPTSVVLYSCTGKLPTILAHQPQILMQTASPALSELRGSNQIERLQQVCLTLTQGVLLMSGLISVVVLAINQGFVYWWVGDAQYGGKGLTIAIAASVMFTHWNVTNFYAVFCFGYEKRSSKVLILDGLVTLAAAVTLVQFWGPIGAPLGSILGKCSISLPANLQILARENQTTILALLRPLGPWLWRFLLIALFINTITYYWQARGFWQLGISAVLTGFLYSLVMLPLVWRDRYLQAQIQEVLAKLPGTSILTRFSREAKSNV